MIFPLQRDIIFFFVPLFFFSLRLCVRRVNVFVQRIEDTLISYAVAYLKAVGIQGFKHLFFRSFSERDINLLFGLYSVVVSVLK